MSRMLALTVWQPWATLIIHHGKTIENRTWPPPTRVVGQRLAIHAGKQIDRAALAEAARVGVKLPDPLPTGALLGTVRLAGAHRATECGCADRCAAWGESGPGVVHWVLADPRRLAWPVSCRGGRRLWYLPDRMLAGGRR